MLHIVSQVTEQIDDDFVIAIPFVGLGVISGVVLLFRVLFHHRPARRLSLAHAAMLVIGLALVVQGVQQESGGVQQEAQL